MTLFSPFSPHFCAANGSTPFGITALSLVLLTCFFPLFFFASLARLAAQIMFFPFLLFLFLPSSSFLLPLCQPGSPSPPESGKTRRTRRKERQLGRSWRDSGEILGFWGSGVLRYFSVWSNFVLCRIQRESKRNKEAKRQRGHGTHTPTHHHTNTSRP